MTLKSVLTNFSDFGVVKVPNLCSTINKKVVTYKGGFLLLLPTISNTVSVRYFKPVIELNILIITNVSKKKVGVYNDDRSFFVVKNVVKIRRVIAKSNLTYFIE